jgi:hypothetical protein
MTIEETAEFLRSELKELEALAKKCGLDALAYLLDVARLEAEHQLMRVRSDSYKT